MSYQTCMSAWAIVREARKRGELTQRQLAEWADKAQSEIAKIERGRRDPRFSTLERLVRAAGFDLRIQLVPHDDHDERLIRAMRELSPDERLASLEEQLEFLAEAQPSAMAGVGRHLSQTGASSPDWPAGLSESLASR
jgi:transcriptional regulator with XRE-family HTH domain